jgi:hypothetical protein
MSARFPITVIPSSGIMIWGLYMFAKAAEFVLHSSKAAGQIVSIEREDTDDGRGKKEWALEKVRKVCILMARLQL